MRRTLLSLLVIVVMAGAPAVAAAAGCVKKKGGKLFSRETCRKSERPFDASTLTPTGTTGPDGARGEAGKFPLAIVDAADRELGPVLTFDLGVTLVRVTHAALPSSMVFAVTPNGFGNLGDDAYSGVYYTEAGCAGTPYLPGGLGTYVHVEGTAAYLPAGEPTSIAVIWIETGQFVACTGNLTDRGTCCRAQAFTADDAVPATRFPLADLGFTTPFRAVPR
jgi:hypothetical protein